MPRATASWMEQLSGGAAITVPSTWKRPRSGRAHRTELRPDRLFPFIVVAVGRDDDAAAERGVLPAKLRHGGHVRAADRLARTVLRIWRSSRMSVLSAPGS